MVAKHRLDVSRHQFAILKGFIFSSTPKNKPMDNKGYLWGSNLPKNSSYGSNVSKIAIEVEYSVLGNNDPVQPGGRK